MLNRMRENFLLLEVKKYLFMEGISKEMKEKMLDEVGAKARQALKNGKISNEFFYKYFFVFHKGQKYWKVHKRSFEENFKKVLTDQGLSDILQSR